MGRGGVGVEEEEEDDRGGEGGGDGTYVFLISHQSQVFIEDLANDIA